MADTKTAEKPKKQISLSQIVERQSLNGHGRPAVVNLATGEDVEAETLRDVLDKPLYAWYQWNDCAVPIELDMMRLDAKAKESFEELQLEAMMLQRKTIAPGVLAAQKAGRQLSDEETMRIAMEADEKSLRGSIEMNRRMERAQKAMLAPCVTWCGDEANAPTLETLLAGAPLSNVQWAAIQRAANPILNPSEATEKLDAPNTTPAASEGQEVAGGAIPQKSDG